MSARTVTLVDGDARHEAAVDAARFEVIDPAGPAAAALADEDVGFALSSPIESPALEEIVGPGERALVVVSAAEDPFGSARLAALVTVRLLGLGLSAEDVSVLVGLGPSAPLGDDEARALVGAALPAGVAVRGHDGSDVAEVGETSRGTPVEVNRLLLEADHVIAVGTIGFHHLRGFTGGRDAFVPAVASERSAAAVRLLAAAPGGARRTGVGPGRLDGNAVHEDLEEAARMLDVSFLVNVTRDAAGDAAFAYAGDWRHAHRRGCAEYAASHGVRVDARRDVALVSAGALGEGGLGSAHRAAEHAAGIVRDGGSIVVAAGRLVAPGLSDPFPAPGAGPGALAGWALRALAARFRLMVVPTAGADVASALGAESFDSVEQALAAAGGGDGYVLPSAISTLPYVGPPPDLG